MGAGVQGTGEGRADPLLAGRGLPDIYRGGRRCFLLEIALWL